MTDFTDLSHLPKAKPQGEPPDEHPRFGPLLIERRHQMALEKDAEWERTHPNPKRFAYSMAGNCSRKLAYYALRVPKSNPPDPQAHYTFWLGDVIHEELQIAVADAYPDANIELRVREDDPEMGGRIDIVVYMPDGRIVVIEAKSIGGYGYKLKSAAFNGPPEGPSLEHKLQGALGATDVNADELVIVYVAKDPNNWAKGDPMLKVTAEWTYTREEFEPWAEKERWRIAKILEMLDEGMLPARKIPELALKHPHHLILQPSKGEWAEQNEAGEWIFPDSYKPYALCNYCDWQDICSRTGAEREPVSVLVEIGALTEEALNGRGDPRGQ